MDKTIRKLDTSVWGNLRSDIFITSFGRAVAELLQNSIDSGATSINVKIDLECLNVCVYDNGSGINSEYLSTLGKRYYTSKIRILDDLKRINTFGFRGEALHSLVMTSDVIAFTKDHQSADIYSIKLNDLGNDVSRIERGLKGIELLKKYLLESALKKHGSIFVLSNFFKNNRIRRRIVKNRSKFEVLEEIREYILHSLIRLPQIKFEFEVLDEDVSEFRQKKVIDIRMAKDETIENNYSKIMKSIFGSSFNDYDPISATVSNYEIHGIIGKKPSITDRYQYIYINGWMTIIPRSIRIKICKIFANYGFKLEVLNLSTSKSNLSPKKKVSSSRKGGLSSRFPIFVLNINCQDLFDELFQDSSKCIYKTRHWDTIAKIILSVFEKYLIVKGHHKINTSSNNKSPNRKKVGLVHQDIDGSNDEYSDSASHSQDSTFSLPNIKRSSNYFSKSHHYQLSKLDLSRCRIVKQLDNKFILLVHNDSSNGATLLIADQHACDERIRVEDLLKEFVFQLANNIVNLHSPISEPYKLPISPYETNLFERYSYNFSYFGIRYSLKDDILTVNELPQLLIDRPRMDLNELKYGLLEHLYCLHNNSKKSDIIIDPCDWFNLSLQLPNFLIEIINRNACRSSIMFGDKLNEHEMQYLINNLQRCHLPFQCAHGRPVILPIATTKDFNSLGKDVQY